MISETPYSPILDAILGLLQIPAVEKDHLQQKFKTEQCHKMRVIYPRIVPLAEYFARRKHTSTVIARISRLNPGGFEEGGYIRGWHPKVRCDFTLDVLPLRTYVERWGSDRGATIGHKSGRWKFVTRLSYVQGPR